MPHRFITLVIAALAVAVFGWAEPARACSCLRPDSAYAHLKGADVVFRGRVVRSVRLPPEPGEAHSYRLSTTFTGVRVHRGAATRMVRVSHNDETCCICGLVFTPGQEVLIFAHRTQDGLSTSTCSRPQFAWSEYAAALKRLKREETRD